MHAAADESALRLVTGLAAPRLRPRRRAPDDPPRLRQRPLRPHRPRARRPGQSRALRLRPLRARRSSASSAGRWSPTPVAEAWLAGDPRLRRAPRLEAGDRIPPELLAGRQPRRHPRWLMALSSPRNSPTSAGSTPSATTPTAASDRCAWIWPARLAARTSRRRYPQETPHQREGGPTPLSIAVPRRISSFLLTLEIIMSVISAIHLEPQRSGSISSTTQFDFVARDPGR